MWRGEWIIADSETAKEAWRSIKNGAMSLSFGYMVEKSRKASGGVNDLLSIDLFEVSIVPAPAQRRHPRS
jgi:phage head maturation protease